MIHRDIKPENIMFLKSERGEELSLIVFGRGVIDGLNSNSNSERPLEDVQMGIYLG